MSQGRGDLGPGSYSLLWFLHSKLRFKRQRLSLQIQGTTSRAAVLRLKEMTIVQKDHSLFPGVYYGTRTAITKIQTITYHWLCNCLD